MKTLEAYANKSSDRDKAMARLNSSLVTLSDARKRVAKAERAFGKVDEEAKVTYDEGIVVAQQKLIEAQKLFEQTQVDLKKDYDNTVNNAKSAIGVAKSEEEKAIKAYDLARKRVDKLMPPPIEEVTEGEDDADAHDTEET